jgi:hypothetical protein
VGERDLQPHAVRPDASVAIRELPEQQQQPVLEPVVLGDREHGGQAARAQQTALREPGRHLGERRHAGQPRQIEHRETEVREHPPRGLERQGDLLAVVPPRLQEVARAEQLGAVAVLDAHAADEDPFEHEQPGAVTAAIGVLARGPGAARAPQDNGAARLLGVG